MNERENLKRLNLAQKNTFIKAGGITGVVLASIIFVIAILAIVVLALACTLLSKASGTVDNLNDIIDLGQIGKYISGGVDGVSSQVKQILTWAIIFIAFEVAGLVISILILSINRLHPAVELVFSIIIFITDPIAGIILLIGVILSFVHRHKVLRDDKKLQTK
jgi:hypothetical protein